MRISSSLLVDFLISLRFATRIAIPALAIETAPQSFSRAMRMFPAAGALVGFLAAIALIAASALGLPPLLAAPLSIAVLIVLTGALHEDGLADCADGFGGGATRQRKLEIMADSRIGAFGALALALALYLRAAAVALIAGKSLPLAFMVLIGAGAASRAASLIPLVVLPPARDSGLGFSARPQATSLATPGLFALAFVALTLLVGATPAQAAAGLAASAAAGFLVCLVAKRQIGGQTGDVAGAAQQVAEIAFYLCFATRS